MAEELTSASNEVEEVSGAVDPIETLKQIQENSVPKEEYERVVAERNKIFAAYAKGERKEEETPKTPPVDIQKLRNELYGGDKDLSNLEYIEKTLQLRQALIDRGEVDPFIPIGHKYNPTAEDIAAAKRVAEGFQHCVDYAEGDSEVFTNELQRITVDVGPTLIKRNKKF